MKKNSTDRDREEKSVIIGKMENELQLIHRHVELLKTVMRHEPIGIIRLSEMLKCPQHKVRYTLRILEQEGLIEASPDGAVTTKKVQGFMEELRATLDGMSAMIKEVRAKLD